MLAQNNDHDKKAQSDNKTITKNGSHRFQLDILRQKTQENYCYYEIWKTYTKLEKYIFILSLSISLIFTILGFIYAFPDDNRDLNCLSDECLFLDNDEAYNQYFSNRNEFECAILYFRKNTTYSFEDDSQFLKFYDQKYLQGSFSSLNSCLQVNNLQNFISNDQNQDYSENNNNKTYFCEPLLNFEEEYFEASNTQNYYTVLGRLKRERAQELHQLVSWRTECLISGSGSNIDSQRFDPVFYQEYVSEENLAITIKEDYFYDDLKKWSVRQYVGTVMMFVGLAMVLAVMIMFCVCR